MARKTLLKRVVSSFTAAALAIVAMPVIPAFAETGVTTYSFDGYDVEYSVKNEWTEGQSVEVKITNTGDEPILNWAFKYNAEGEIRDLWNASVYDTKETSYIIKNVGWNYEIAPDASVSFGYTLSDYSGTNPDKFELCAKRVDKTDGYDVQYNITNEWDTGLQGEIVITNTSEEPIEFWQLSFNSDVTIDSIWNASVDKQEESHYTISSGNTPINAGESKTFGFIGTKTSELNSISNFSLSTVVVEGLGENGSIFNNGQTDENNTGNNNSEENENVVSEECYPYTMFAASSDEGAITINADNFCVNGDIATNGTILFSRNKKVNGKKIENAGLKPFYLFDKIKSKYLSSPSCYQIEEDYSLNNDNILVNDPVNVKGKVSLNGTIGITSAVEAIESIALKGSVINISGAVVCSKYRDVYIEGQNVSASGLIYAPFGEVKIISPNLNLNNVVVIANKIYLESSSINVNNNVDFAQFIGQDSELISVPFDEFKYLPDTDCDDIPDVIEEQLGIDPYNPDTDGDSLNDGYEVLTTFTDPAKVDTNENGVNDSDEDFDSDGLTNIEEYNNKTNPYLSDTDNDGLSDGTEVKVYGTNPLSFDTDEDGLEDADEIAVGTDPSDSDTDDDGILDCDEKIDQTFTHIVENKECAIEEVIITVEGTGNIQTNTTVESVMGRDVICSEVVGLIGEPFSIETTSRFDTATLTFKIDQSKLGDTAFDDIMFLWYDEQNYEFVELETLYDYENSTVSISTSHFSKYMIVDKKAWYNAWKIELDYNPTNGVSGAPTIQVKYNTVLAIDCSGSMDWNDKIKTKSNINSANDAMYAHTCNRIVASENYINIMGTNDEAAIVFFTSNSSVAASMTNNKDALKIALQKMYSSGGTSFYAALNESLKQFDNVGTIPNYVDKNRIILLSDGDDGDSSVNRDNAIKKCQDKFIEVYTVGFGSANDQILRHIAEETGGEYYKAFMAEDIIDILKTIGYSGDFDTTDTDNDGLYDAVEAAGIRLQNGKIIYTDPTDPDSDDDGLLDGEEIDPTIRRYYGSGMPSDVAERQPYYFVKISDPNNIDSDGDGDLDNVDPHKLSYQVNDLFIANVALVYDYAKEYSKNIKYDSEKFSNKFPEALTFMFIKYFEIDFTGKHKYCIGSWPGVSGKLDESFIEYVKSKNNDIYNYFTLTDAISSKPYLLDIDLNHMAATLSGLLYKSGFSDGIRQGLMPENHIDDLCGWAGDLQSLINDSYNDSQKNSEKSIVDYFSENLGDNNSRCGIYDLNSDADAVNLYCMITTQDISLPKILTNYYKSDVSCRYSKFLTDGLKGSKETIDPYTKSKYLGLVQWPIFEDELVVTEKDSEVIKNVFWDYIRELIKLEEEK